MSQTQPVVAIVDDDVSIQRALARLLSTAGWHAVPFSSAEAFLQTGMQTSPDCLVLDVWLPGMTGVELLEHLAAMDSTLPAVIVTGRDDLQMRMRAMQAGAVAYILKPLDGQDLLSALREALGGRRLSGSS
jgi:two-component system, LuxR family, response regulator FixJ